MRISTNASDAELLAIVQVWIDVLAAGDYERFFGEFGYALARGRGANGIREDIEGYRSEALYPGVTQFRVTPPISARGGNPEPLALVRRYARSESLPIVATIEVHLPLNGRWSDLEADFVVTAEDALDISGILSLEDICCPAPTP